MPRTLAVGAPSRFVTATAWLALLLATVLALLAGWQLPGAFGLGVVLLALAQAASALGLMLRLEGARRAFMGCSALGVAALLGALWWRAGALPWPITCAASLAAPALTAWVLGRLSSWRVRQEFSCA